MKKSGLADSPFFTNLVSVPVAPPQTTSLPKKYVEKHEVKSTPEKKLIKKTAKDTRKPSPQPHHEEKIAPLNPSNRDTAVSHTQDEILETVRKASQELGKEAATHRFTVAEKRHIAEIIFTYQTQGIKTSENEIARIALNYLIEDYKANGENSLLDRVLKAINK